MNNLEVPQKGPSLPKNSTLASVGEGLKGMYSWLTARNTSAYYPNAAEPYVETVTPAGMTFRTAVSGQTYMLLEERMLPIEGTPFFREYSRLRSALQPDRATTAALLFCLAVGVLCVCVAMFSDTEMRASWASTFAWWFSGIMAISLLVSAACAAIVLLLWNFGRGIRIQFSPFEIQTAHRPLAAGALNIAPDLLMYTMPGETARAHAERVVQAIDTAAPGVWIVAAPFRSQVWQIHASPDMVMQFQRSEICSDLEGWPSPITAMRNFTYETEVEYERCLEDFAALYSDWARAKKVVVATEEGEAAGDAMRSTWETISRLGAMIFALLLFALPVFAQPKSEQVREYLGDRRAAIIVPPKSQMSFRFVEGTISREGDGKMNVIALLKSPSTYSDADNMGSLIGIYHNGEAIKPIPKKQGPADMQKPADFSMMRADAGRGWTMDSITSDESIRKAERQFEEGLKKADEWSLKIMVSNLSLYIFHLLIGLIGLLYFTATCFNNEGRLRPWGSVAYGRWPMIIGNAASFCTLCLCVVTGVLFMAFVGYNLFFGSLWRVVWIILSWNTVLCLIWFGMLRLAILVVDALTPNPIVMDQFRFGENKGLGPGKQ